MGWPAPSTSNVVVSATAKERAKKAAWDAEVAELRARKAARDDESNSLPIDGETGHLIGIIQSDGFARLYEELTGKNAGEWVRSVLRASDYVLKVSGTTRADWIRSKLADMAAKHFWGEPWYRVHIADQITRSRSRSERRNLRVRLATPKWANPLKIAMVYRQRDRMTAETGIEHEVDHIVPLTHPRVCGLHCEANLRVVTVAENRQKSNTFYI